MVVVVVDRVLPKERKALKVHQSKSATMKGEMMPRSYRKEILLFRPRASALFKGNVFSSLDIYKSPGQLRTREKEEKTLFPTLVGVKKKVVGEKKRALRHFLETV